MYIVAIGWLYVALMMAITETNVVAGVATFLCYGLAPVSLVMYILGTPGRRQRRRAREEAEARAAVDAAETRQAPATPTTRGTSNAPSSAVRDGDA
ncbi:hypothetical protein [Cupriavidus sp. DL-D2]|uniref:hypothetical protein n=1 Tax=Cupriavidus sp. DL-D2 TaxID=3144974 RepID=UPI003215594C